MKRYWILVVIALALIGALFTGGAYLSLQKPVVHYPILSGCQRASLADTSMTQLAASIIKGMGAIDPQTKVGECTIDLGPQGVKDSGGFKFISDQDLRDASDMIASSLDEPHLVDSHIVAGDLRYTTLALFRGDESLVLPGGLPFIVLGKSALNYAIYVVQGPQR